MNTVFLHSPEFEKFDYGLSHPLKTLRLKLTRELIGTYGLLSLPNTRLIRPEMADEEDLKLFHDPEYIEVLKAANNGISVAGAGYFGLGSGDNPVFRGLLDWSRLVTGASLRAAEMVESGDADIAFSISGGLHHAMPSRASGFCYVNDAAIAIMSLLEKGRRVAYIDIDAHHGDGVQEAFYETDQVLTISLHETGNALFPGTGFETDLGRGKGEGYSINIPMPPGSDDELLLFAFSEIVPPLIRKFGPDIVVTQLGVDSFRNDPLAHLNGTTNGFCEMVSAIRDFSRPWVALGGGGYDVAGVARAWTLAWAVMNGVDIADDIPGDFLSAYQREGFGSGKIRDKRYLVQGREKEIMRQEVERVVTFLKAQAL